MAIKVTLGATENTQQEKPFPKLMKLNDGIFLFLSPRKCVCLKETKGVYTEYWELGEYCQTAQMQYFTPFNEPITLINE